MEIPAVSLVRFTTRSNQVRAGAWIDSTSNGSALQTSVPWAKAWNSPGKRSGEQKAATRGSSDGQGVGGSWESVGFMVGVEGWGVMAVNAFPARSG